MARSCLAVDGEVISITLGAEKGTGRQTGQPGPPA